MINKIENQLYLALTDSQQFPFLEVLVICSINYDFTIHGRCYTYAVISLVKITGWINWITIQKLHCNSNYQFSGVKFNVLQQLSRLFLPHISRLESPYLQNAHYLSKSEGEGRGDRSWRCVYNADVWSSDGQERYIRSSRVSRLTNNCSRFSLHFFGFFIFYLKPFV